MDKKDKGQGEMKAVKEIREVEHSTDCAFCEDSLNDDPYLVTLDDGTKLILCNTCGPNFADAFNLRIKEKE